MPVLVYDQQGHTPPHLYVFNQGDVAHLPYAFLALFFLLTFTLLPMLLLFLYPCSCFQACLNRTGCSWQPLHTFMDAFQGHYKNGTHGTRDLRFFSGLYLLLRLVVYASTVLTYQISSFAYTTVFIGVLTLGVALARPYKKYIFNVIDAFFLAMLATFSIMVLPLGFGQPLRILQSLNAINLPLLVIAIMYSVALVAYWFKSWRCISQCWYTLRQKLRGEHSPTFINRENYEILQSY